MAHRNPYSIPPSEYITEIERLQARVDELEALLRADGRPGVQAEALAQREMAEYLVPLIAKLEAEPTYALAVYVGVTELLWRLDFGADMEQAIKEIETEVIPELRSLHDHALQRTHIRSIRLALAREDR